MASVKSRRCVLVDHVVAQHAARWHPRRASCLPRPLLVRSLPLTCSRRRRAVQVGTEGGDFNHLVLAPAMHHVNDAKAPPNDEGAAKVFPFFRAWRR